MPTYLLKYTLCLVLIAGGASTTLAQNDIRFRAKLLTVDANEGVAIADVNNDGKSDVVAGRNWFPAPDFTPRPLRSIADWNGYVESNGDFAFDVNRDGWTDIIAGSFLPTKVHWYQNPGQDGLALGQLWKQNLLVETNQSQNEASFLRDLDGDDIPEWISNSWKADNPVNVFQFQYDGNGKNPSVVKHVIGQEGNSHGMGFGDINNDGREDILIATGWYERPPGDLFASRWKFHADWNLGQASCPILVRDLDGDGLNDFVWGKGHDFGLQWWQAKGAKDGKLIFEAHVIDERYSQAHVIHFADLNGDQVDELITGKRVRAHNGGDPGGKDVACMYFYSWDAASKSFERQVIDEGHVGTGLQIRTADLNSDGRVDIAVAGKDGTWILFNEPMSKD